MNPKKLFSASGTFVPEVHKKKKNTEIAESTDVVEETTTETMVAVVEEASPETLLTDTDMEGCSPPEEDPVSEQIAELDSAPEKKDGKNRVWSFVRRSLLVVFTLVILFVYGVFTLCATIANGPSPTVRNLLVLSALQASATKWVPGLFLDDETVDGILSDSFVINKDVISLEDYVASLAPSGGGDGDTTVADEWANAQDGMLFHTISGSTYKAYVLLVKDPSRVFVGTSSDFQGDAPGARIFDIVEWENAVAAINAGEYWAVGGSGTGDKPIALTYSKGACVWSDQFRRTFIGFDKNNRLVVSEKMTQAKADELGIRDAVSFQNGNVLIDHDGDNLHLYYADSNTGTAQRTAIGQRADGTVILLVTDGRTASSLGATHNDVIDIMVSYGAVTAGMLDGGSSTLMYYDDYFTKYDIDVSKLDQYQKRGLVNKYKAFTTPRKMPTYFLVAREGANTEVQK